MAIDNNEYTGIIMQRIFENGVCTDRITLISGKDNHSIPIHRNVLIAASKYFAALLGPNFQEGSKSEFILNDTDGQTVKAIVDFCYTGRIDLTEENVKKFLTITSSVEFDLLERKCRRFYNDNLTAKNAAETLIVADRNAYVDLRQRAFDIVCGSLEILPADELQKLDHRLLRELLKYDKIQTTEDSVFKRLMEWFQHNEEERKQYMPELLKLIRLEHISSQYLGDTVVTLYETFQLSERVLAEFKKRSSIQCSSIDFRRSRLIFCLFRQLKGINGAKYSAIKIERYNNVLNSYEEAAEITLGDRECFNVVLQQNKLFVLGGTTNGVFSKCISSYDLSSCKESILPEMNKSRGFCSPILFGKSIYVFGGFDNGNAISSCERFVTEKNEWKEMKSMKNARYWTSAAVLNGYVYVAGGISGGRHLTSVELYDPKCDEWTKIKPMNSARSGFELVEWNGFLYAMGGGVKIIEKYDPYKVCWTQIGSFEDSDLITDGINVDGQIFVVMRNGKCGEIIIGENDKCSFRPLGKSNYVSEGCGQHFLYHN